MNIFNAFIKLLSFQDSQTSSPQLNHFKWSREILNIPVHDPTSIEYTLAPGEQVELFNALRTLGHDNTTQYNLSHDYSGIYKLEWTGTGSHPQFRIPRAIGIDATTEVSLSVDINTGLVTLTTPNGTPINTSNINIGDIIYLSNAIFAANNAGSFIVLSVTPTSIIYKNSSATPQTVVLGANFNKKLKVFSNTGVQKNDYVLIRHSNFGIVNGLYVIKNVTDDTIWFYSPHVLPPTIQSGFDLQIFSGAKQFIYLETSQPLAIQVNNVWESDVEIFTCKPPQPGIYFKKSLVYKLVIKNKSLTDNAKIYFASAE